MWNHMGCFGNRRLWGHWGLERLLLRSIAVGSCRRFRHRRLRWSTWHDRLRGHCRLRRSRRWRHGGSGYCRRSWNTSTGDWILISGRTGENFVEHLIHVGVIDVKQSASSLTLSLLRSWSCWWWCACSPMYCMFRGFSSASGGLGPKPCRYLYHGLSSRTHNYMK